MATRANVAAALVWRVLPAVVVAVAAAFWARELVAAAAAEPPPKAGAAAADAGGPGKRVAATLARRMPDVKFDGVALADALDFLRDVSGTDVVVDWGRLERAGVDRNAAVKLAAKNATFGDVLTRVLAQAGAAKERPRHAADGDVLVVSTPAGLAVFAASARTLAGGKPSAALRGQLERRLPEVKFDRVGVGDAVDFLRDASGVAVEADWAALDRAGVKRDAPVTIRLREVGAGQALRLVLATAAPTKEPVGVTAEGDKLVVRPPAAK